MEEIIISSSIKIVLYNSDDFINNNKTISASLNSISKEYNSAEARDYIDDLNGDIFVQNKKVFIYVLFVANEPISFVVFSKISNTCVVLESIYTSYGYTKLGFATILLRIAITNLLKNKINSFVYTQGTNEIMLNLLNSFGEVDGVSREYLKTGMRFNFSNINSAKILGEINKCIIG